MILRILIIVSLVISLAAAIFSFSNYRSYKAEHVQRLDTEAKLLQAQDAVTAAKTEIEQQKAQIADLNAQVEASKKSEQDLKSQLSAKEVENQGLRNNADALTEENKKLKEQVENYKKKERMPAPVVKAPADPAVVAAPGTPGSEQPLKIPSGAEQVIPSEAPLSDDSRILTVNRKFNFIVINLGLRDGLRMGDKVEVLRDGKQIALAQTEKIYDKFSAATLLNEDQGNPVHEGDSINKV